MRSVRAALVIALSAVAATASGDDVVISEFLALNSGPLVDADGDSSDWIELHHRGDAPVDLSGWYLTDDASDLFRWPFPSRTIEPGAYLVVFASGKDRAPFEEEGESELHTNFSLDGAGEYLALVRPDGTVASEFAPRFPPQRSDVSYGTGERVVGDRLLGAGDPARVLVPRDGSLGRRWTGDPSEEPFDDSDGAGWSAALLGVGYPAGSGPDAPAPIGYWSFDGLAQDATGRGHAGVVHGAIYQDDVPPALGRGQSLRFDGSGDYVSVAIDVSETSYTASLWFRAAAGDGGLFSVVDEELGGGGHDRHIYLDGSGLSTRVWSNETISTSGRRYDDGEWHHVAHVMGPRTGGQEIWVDGEMMARGSQALSDFNWQRHIQIGFSNDAAQSYFEGDIDDVAVWSAELDADQIRALSAGASPLAISGYAPYVETDIESAMRGVNASVYVRAPFDLELPTGPESLRLRMRCDDGFVAYLNGVEIARRDAPASPGFDATATEEPALGEVLRGQEVCLDGQGDLLRDGTNVLAIHGLNASADGDDLLVFPELVRVEEVADRYFLEPTPGAPNDLTSVAGFVADTRFSVDRGVFTEPFDVEITSETLGAEIRFTLDGSEPTASHGRVYTDPIRVEGTTILRAAAFRPDLGPTNVDTQTYLFPTDVVRQPAMLTDVTTHLVYGPLIEPALRLLPTVSIVTPRAINTASEVEASVELIHPDGSRGFQIEAGIRKVGGHSLGYPKNNMRLFFRREYGHVRLEHPVFAGTRYAEGAAERFDQLNLRSGSHDTVFYLGTGTQPPSDAQYVRNRWINDLQFEMGQLSLHGFFVHVYINGTYWGHYHLMERPTRSYMAEYLGGEKETYEAVNGGRTVGPASPGWREIATIRSDYEEVTSRVDVGSLVDYMLLNFYAGNDWDWFPDHNWMAAGPSTADLGGYRFFNWDSDIILRRTDDYNLDQSGPGNLFRDLLRHEPFRVLLADRIHRHFFNGGILTAARARELYDLRAEEIYPSIVAETARWRWGGVVWTRDVQWQRELDRLRSDFFPRRSDIVMDQIRRAGWYPDVPAPVFVVGGRPQHGGAVDADTRLEMVVPGLETFVEAPLRAAEDPVSVHIPQSAALDGDWFSPDYVEGSRGETWRTGAGGVGYEHGSGYEAAIGIDVEAEMAGEPGSSSAFLRLPFDLTDPEAIAGLETLYLKMLYDDGFVAYLNGVRVLAINAPGPSDLAWNSLATGSNEADIASPEVFAIEDAGGLLRPGTNLLAIHGLNFARSSSDMLIAAELVERRLESTPAEDSVFYTLDGTDPRAPTAHGYDAPIPLDQTTIVKACATDGSAWSAMSEALYVVPGSFRLRITEIMYHPHDPPAGSPHSGDDFEFIELQNTGSRTVELSGVRLRGGIDFDFSRSEVPALAPGEFVVIVRDLAAFRTRYDADSMAIAGEYAGRLSNGGESLRLTGPFGETVLEFRYDDAWYPPTDGGGGSLVIVSPALEPAAWGDAASWSLSAGLGGSPGGPDLVTVQGGLQRPGDANQDGVLDLSDAVSILLRLFGDPGRPLPCTGGLDEEGNRAVLDFDGSSTVDISDAISILGYLYRDAAPPVFGTECRWVEGCPWACRP